MRRKDSLQGNFAPRRMEGEAPDLDVIGELPRDLCGTYFRNGPNPAFAPPGRYHWFDGDGTIHAIRLEDGRASYCGVLSSVTAFRAIIAEPVASSLVPRRDPAFRVASSRPAPTTCAAPAPAEVPARAGAGSAIP